MYYDVHLRNFFESECSVACDMYCKTDRERTILSLFLIEISCGGQTNTQLRESPLNEPPKSGFVPRAQDQGISHREAIRHAPSLTVVNSQCAQHALTEKCIPSLMSNVHKDMSTQNVDCILHYSQSHAVSDVKGHGIESHGSQGFTALTRLRPDAPSSLQTLYLPAHLNREHVVAQSEFDKFDRSLQSATAMDSVSNLQFDSLRSEPQLIIS